jgi:PTH1 family peptidyl-tRNA hydrolase
MGSDYWRVRIGIGRPPHEAMDVKSWVLADFGRDEQTGWLATLLDAMADEADRLVVHDDGGFMSRVSYLAPAPQPKIDNGKDSPASAASKPN